MAPRATVLIPTHDHGLTLRYAVASALAQTVADLEVFVVGDGAPEETRALVTELEKDDDRVRYFDNPKGPRHGEIHRHAALSEASGAIVCYLSDDDLWLPEHVERLSGSLRDADFAHAMTAMIHPDGTVGCSSGNLADVRYRRRLLSGSSNFVPLSAAAHTLAFYRRLPEGWRTTPSGIWTDLFMWQQILSQPECRAVSVPCPTVAHFPSHQRDGWAIDRRLEELSSWATELGDPRRRAAFGARLYEIGMSDLREELAGTAARLGWAEPHARRLDEVDRERRTLATEVAHLRDHRRRLEGRVETLEGRIETLETRVARLREKRERLRARLHALEGSATWRLRKRLLKIPLIRPFLRTAARALSAPRRR